MNTEMIRQLKLSSGEEILVEIVEWDNQEDAAIIVKNALEIHFMQTPSGAMRLCTLRPYMVGQVEDGLFQSINAEMVVAQATPTREILTNYRETIDEHMKFNREVEPTDEELDKIEQEEMEEALDNLIPFPSDKNKMH